MMMPSPDQSGYTEYVAGLADSVQHAISPMSALYEIYRTETLITFAAVLRIVKENWT